MIELSVPLSLGPVAGFTVVAAPAATLVFPYVSVGGVLAVTLTCKSPVPVRLPSETWKRTVPAVAVQLALTCAVIVPLVLVMPVTEIPVAVPPAICVTVKLPAAVCKSATVPTVTAAPAGLPCWRLRAAAGVKVGAVFGVRLVNAKLTAAAAPVAFAATLYGPPTVALAVAVTLACPPAIVAGLPVNTALAPAPGGVKVTRPPLTGSALVLLTLTTSGLAKAALVMADWPLPLLTASVKPRDS